MTDIQPKKSSPKKYSPIEVKTSKVAETLANLRRKEEEQAAIKLAEELKLPYINLAAIPVDLDVVGIINEKKAKAAKMAVFQKMDRDLKIAAVNTNLETTKEILKELKNNDYSYKIFICSLRSLEKAWKCYQDLDRLNKEITGRVEISAEVIKKLKEEIKNISDVKQKIEKTKGAATSKVLEIILSGTLQNDASDAHLEAKEENCILRYRIDGILQDVVFLSLQVYHLILNRIKLLSEMKLNVHNAAQDGHFTITLDKIDIEVRVSVIPGDHGENIVMRILNPKTISLELDNLGLRNDLLEKMKEEIKKPNGMIITTGPTGSGKTTALYAFIKRVATRKVKVITLEDPIEYRLQGITQTQIESDRGYTFANGLRAILRQDPDIILVGEIRDQETAKISIHAALTGHLVFSTLHTNDAAGAIPRFIDMKANPSILSAALNVVIAQRLIRKICKKCKTAYNPTKQELQTLKNVLSDLPKDIMPSVLDKNLKIYKGKGCDFCNSTGYKGRIGIFEVILIDNEMEKLISSSPSHVEVQEKAIKKGMITMYQDGLLKVLDGITTIEEVENVIGKE